VFIQSQIVRDTSVISAAAYDPSGGTPPPGWLLVGETGPVVLGGVFDTGFRAFAYQDGSGSLVIAFRGTDPSLPTLFLANLLGADPGFGLPSPFLDTYVAAAVEFVADMRAQFPDAPVVLTGHSLGGGIAQIIGRGTGFETVTFNSPQVGLSADRYYDQVRVLAGGTPIVTDGSNITNVRVEGDVVSSLPLGGNYGSTVTIADPTPARSSPTTPVIISAVQDALEAHSIGTINTELDSPRLIDVRTGPPEAVPFIPFSPTFADSFTKHPLRPARGGVRLRAVHLRSLLHTSFAGLARQQDDHGRLARIGQARPGALHVLHEQRAPRALRRGGDRIGAAGSQGCSAIQRSISPTRDRADARRLR
jgi:hypothetical protein